jgi:hypothetical protein
MQSTLTLDSQQGNWLLNIFRLLRMYSLKLRRAFALLRNPDRFRIYVCNRFPILSSDSALIRWLYPAWWKYLLYKYTFRFIFSGIKAKPDSRNRYLMRAPNAAGIGDQIVTAWSETYVLAKRHKLTFVHHPFLKSHHSPDIDWESFLGFGEEEIKANEILSNRNIKTVYLPPISLASQTGHQILSRLIGSVYKRENVLFHLGTGVYLKSDIDQAETMPAIYRQKYCDARRLSPVKTNFDERYVNVAVHIRRGDLSLLKEKEPFQWERRWIDTSYYLNLLADLTRFLSNASIRFHIYSDGTIEDLSELQGIPNIRFILQGDPRQSFHEMVVADVLIVSTSAFSICAGKISEGIKLVGMNFDDPNFRLFVPTTDDWIQIDQTGHLSVGTREELARQLDRQNKSKLIAGVDGEWSRIRMSQGN